MRGSIFVAVALLFATDASAGARIEFAAYEGPESVMTGDGGTKVTKNGVDFWTSGTPPRRYKVLGRISDRRSEEWDGGHAVGSPTIARKTKEAGGDAVILLDQKDIGTGSSGFGSKGLGSLFMLGSSKTTTAFVVVKYLD